MSQQKDMAQQTEMTQSIQMLDQDVYEVLSAPENDILAQTEALNTMLVNADELIAKADDADNPNLTSLVLIKGSQAIRTQLHLRKTLDAETLETQIEKAREAYQKAFEVAQTPTLKAMAQLGLGLCSEELGQTAQAAEIYQQIVENEDYQATAVPTQAQQRLDNLAENAEVFTFAEVQEALEATAENANQEMPTPAAEPAVEAISAETPPAEEAAEPTE
jgi:tetratricopeptide (TPR) repeat protein